MQCELLANAEERSRLHPIPFQLPPKQFSLAPFITLDAAENKSFDFGAFEDETHDQVVHIFIFYQLSMLSSSQTLQPVDLSNRSYKVLHKYTNLIDDC